MPTDPRVHFLDLIFDALDPAQVLARLSEVTARRPFAYVVTPNVDHVVRLHAANVPDAVHEAYAHADLCLCDSRILSRLARLSGLRLPVVTGSDLTRRLLDDVARPGDRIAIVGGDEALLADLRARYPSFDFVQHQPPMGLARNLAAIDKAAAFVAGAGARFALLVVGSPQQELVALRTLERGDATGLALCVGASLDFIIGKERRAPRLIQQSGFEWAFRLASQPRRLWRRYLVEGPRIFRLYWRWSRRGSVQG